LQAIPREEYHNGRIVVRLHGGRLYVSSNPKIDAHTGLIHHRLDAYTLKAVGIDEFEDVKPAKRIEQGPPQSANKS
jgi:hypothetical protein